MWCVPTGNFKEFQRICNLGILYTNTRQYTHAAIFESAASSYDVKNNEISHEYLDRQRERESYMIRAGKCFRSKVRSANHSPSGYEFHPRSLRLSPSESMWGYFQRRSKGKTGNNWSRRIDPLLCEWSNRETGDTYPTSANGCVG
jgi:hypothetical protein